MLWQIIILLFYQIFDDVTLCSSFYSSSPCCLNRLWSHCFSFLVWVSEAFRPGWFCCLRKSKWESVSQSCSQSLISSLLSREHGSSKNHLALIQTLWVRTWFFCAALSGITWPRHADRLKIFGLLHSSAYNILFLH